MISTVLLGDTEGEVTQQKLPSEVILSLRSKPTVLGWMAKCSDQIHSPIPVGCTTKCLVGRICKHLQVTCSHQVLSEIPANAVNFGSAIQELPDVVS